MGLLRKLKQSDTTLLEMELYMLGEYYILRSIPSAGMYKWCVLGKFLNVSESWFLTT